MKSKDYIADLSIPLRFDGTQPNAFGVDEAKAKVLGDTRNGSSVNFATYTFTPHCNGTHTECVGHITDERISIRECLSEVIIDSLLITVEHITTANCREKYSSGFSEGDRLITRASLENSFFTVAANVESEVVKAKAVIVRTLPNTDAKLSASYSADSPPPYFTNDAIEYLVALGCRHLLTDLPSIDRMEDGGMLSNHRLFWNVEMGSREVDRATRINATITELIYVPDEVEDGIYKLNLQIAPFETDAAPSRPLLLRN